MGNPRFIPGFELRTSDTQRSPYYREFINAYPGDWIWELLQKSIVRIEILTNIALPVFLRKKDIVSG